MKRLHAFLEEMDEEWLRRHHRWRAQEMAARMSLSSGRDSTDGSADVTTGHIVTRRRGSRGNGRARHCAGPGLLVIQTWFSYLCGGIHGPSADGLVASTLCRIGGWATAGRVRRLFRSEIGCRPWYSLLHRGRYLLF